jgi:hypothetical protein
LECRAGVARSCAPSNLHCAFRSLLTLVWACCAQLDSALQELCKGCAVNGTTYLRAQEEDIEGLWPYTRRLCKHVGKDLEFAAWVARCCAQACIVRCICAYRACLGYSRSGLGSALLRAGLQCTMCLRVSRLIRVLRCCRAFFAHVLNVALQAK